MGRRYVGTTDLGWLRRPTTWATTYLGLIVVFAIVYRLQVGSFYYATAQFEPAVNNAAHRVADLLERDLEAQIKRYNASFLHGNVLDKGEGWSLDIERDIYILPVAADAEYLKYSVYERPIISGQLFNSVHQLALDFSPDAFAAPRNLTEGFRIAFAVYDEPRNPDGPFTIRDLYVSLPGQSTIPGFIPIEVSLELERESKAYFRAVNGNPQAVSGGFARMLYLSVATLSTAGQGDIVPVTGVARTLVTAEAICGILVLGLFLNSLVALGRQNKVDRRRR